MLSKFRFNLGVVTTASLISFMISLGLTPVMTRWYLPEDYGTFAIVNNLATFLATAFLLSLPNALPMEPLWHRRAQLIRALISLAVFAFIMSAVVVAIYTGIVFAAGEMDGTQWIYASMPFLVLAISLHRISQGWANADGDFRSMAAARIVHPLGAKPPAIAASMLTTSNSLYMIFFEGIGYLCQSFIMVHGRFRRLKRFPRLLTRRRIALTFGIVRRHIDYSLYDNLVSLLMLGSITLQTMILAKNYSVTETGLFSLAMSMTNLPVQLVALATAPVIYHQLVRISRDEAGLLLQKVVKIFAAFMLLGAIPYLVLFLYGPGLFDVVFGSKWIQSGNVSSLFSIPLFLQFLGTPLISIFRVTRTLRLQFWIDMTFIVPTIILFYLVTRSMPFLDALTVLVIALSIHRFVTLGCCFLVAWRASRANSL